MEPNQSPSPEQPAEPSGADQEIKARSGSTTVENTAALQSLVIKVSTGAAARVMAWIGWIGLLICIPIIIGQSAAYQEYWNKSGGIGEKYHSRDKSADSKIAIIDISGMILGGEGYVKKQIDRVREDENVKAVVLRVNSPGGTVSGSDYIYHHLTKLREDRKLPMVVSMGGIAASGGYYVSMAAGYYDAEGKLKRDKVIYAEPTTWTGSIGVIIPYYDLTELMKKVGVQDNSFKSGEFKQLLSMTREIKEEEKPIIQDLVRQSFDRFKKIVVEGRPRLQAEPDLLKKATTGQVFTAEDAWALGLIDEKDKFIEDAIDRAAELARLPKNEVRVIRYERPATLLELTGLMNESPRGAAMQQLLAAHAPRAWYLFSTLPPLASSRE